MASEQGRGPYAKGVAKREQLLTEALAAYAEQEGNGPSLKAIAARVGLSERGLLHYFGSRDELFAQILIERDRRLRDTFELTQPVEKLQAAIAQQARTPGLSRLYVEMAAGATPGTPAHGFFESHYRELTADVIRMLDIPPETEEADDAAAGSAADDREFLARILIAAADGLQLRSLIDDGVELSADLVRLVDVIRAVG